MNTSKVVLNNLKDVASWEPKKQSVFLERLIVHMESGENTENSVQEAYLDTYGLPEDGRLGAGNYKSNLG